MPVTSSDVIKIIFAIILPPIGVLLERGCGVDLLINILLTILGYIPGTIHLYEHNFMFRNHSCTVYHLKVLKGLKCIICINIACYSIKGQMQAIPSLSPLLKPINLPQAARTTEHACMRLIDAIFKAEGDDIVDRFDDLSNRLCLLLDPVECIRLTSQDRKLRIAANEARAILTPFLETVNRDVQLYRKLEKWSLNSGENVDLERQAVARSLMTEYRYYGMHLPDLRSISELHREHNKLMEACANDFEWKSTTSRYSELFLKRRELARALGYDSFSSLVSVRNTLKSREQILSLIARHLSAPFKSHLFLDTDLAEAPNWNCLSNVLERFCSLAKILFDIDIALSQSDQDIHHMHVKYRDNPLISGTIIIDPLHRPDKKIGPSHFTLIGSKIISKEEFQQPVMYVSCNIKNVDGLSFSDISSLFHELGHALHGALSRTRFQSISGTRVPKDAAEIPSVLFEKLTHQWQVMRFLGCPKSFEDEFTLHVARVHSLKAGNAKIAFADSLAHCSDHLSLKNISMQADWQFGICNESRTPWINRIEHLNSYGGSYYAYLLADRIADNLISGLDLTKGKNLVEHVLCRGDSINPLNELAKLDINLDDQAGSISNAQDIKMS